MSYSAAAIGLAGLGLNSYIQRASRKYGPSAQSLQRTMPVNKVDYNAARIQALSKAINRYKPAVESTVQSFTLSFSAGAGEGTNAITGSLATDGDFQAKMLGDRCRLIGYHLRWKTANTDPQCVRYILYSPYNTGERITGIDFQSILDTSKFRILKDITIWPGTNLNSAGRPNVGTFYVPLKGRMVRYDRTSATAMTVSNGEIVLYVVATSSVLNTIAFQHKVIFQNK